ncbi:MAG: hypothetical protein ACK5Y2_13800 [Bdellovibrionales bacterium]
MSFTAWLLLQSACTYYMTGVIWLVQLVQYPCFSNIARDQFHDFHNRHTAMMGVLVGPVMLIELASALVLTLKFEKLWILNLMPLCLIWYVTFRVSVPLHHQLSLNYSESAVQSLVSTNWIRTWAWTARAGLVTWALWQTLMVAEAGKIP